MSPQRMNEISASEIIHVGGNKEGQTTIDDNFEQYMIGQEESHAMGYEQEEEENKEDSV